MVLLDYKRLLTIYKLFIKNFNVLLIMYILGYILTSDSLYL